jgi:hypothetical protein
VALLLSGALLYTGLHFVMQPTFRLAYLSGGVQFHSYAMLAPFLLPLGLIAPARLSGRRWAPVVVMAIVIAIALVGRVVASTGFDMIKPVSVIDQEIVKDPTSPIAVGQAIMRKNVAKPDPLGPVGPFLVPLVSALVIGLVDARRRPVWATVAYGVSVFIMMGLRQAGLPAFAPLIPETSATAVAAVITVGVAFISGWLVTRVSDRLESAAPSR